MRKIAVLAVGLLITPVVAGVPAPGHPSRVDYTVQITNTMSHPMDFFYRDTTEHSLGTIPAFLSQRFVIRSPARTSVDIVERGDAMGIYEMWKTVELSADSVVAVTF